MRRMLLVCAAAASLLAGEALACSPPPGWPQKVRVSPKVIAEVMAKAAAHIDLVVVEHLSKDFVISELPSWYAEELPQAERVATWREDIGGTDAVRMHLRVLRSLKGGSADSLELSGIVIEGLGARWIASNLASKIVSMLDEQDLAHWREPGSCDTAIPAMDGAQYLVFRDADGRLMRQPVPIRFRGYANTHIGPGALPVTGERDPWVELVVQALKPGSP